MKLSGIVAVYDENGEFVEVRDLGGEPVDVKPGRVFPAIVVRPDLEPGESYGAPAVVLSGGTATVTYPVLEAPPPPTPSTPSLVSIATLHVEEGMVSGVETATGLAFAFMVDTDVLWVFFNEAMPDLGYGWNVNSTSGVARVTDRQLDYFQVTIEGATEPYDVSIQLYRVV